MYTTFYGLPKFDCCKKYRPTDYENRTLWGNYTRTQFWPVKNDPALLEKFWPVGD